MLNVCVLLETKQKNVGSAAILKVSTTHRWTEECPLSVSTQPWLSKFPRGFTFLSEFLLSLFSPHFLFHFHLSHWIFNLTSTFLSAFSFLPPPFSQNFQSHFHFSFCIFFFTIPFIQHIFFFYIHFCIFYFKVPFWFFSFTFTFLSAFLHSFSFSLSPFQ